MKGKTSLRALIKLVAVVAMLAFASVGSAMQLTLEINWGEEAFDAQIDAILFEIRDGGGNPVVLTELEYHSTQLDVNGDYISKWIWVGMPPSTGESWWWAIDDAMEFIPLENEIPLSQSVDDTEYIPNR